MTRIGARTIGTALAILVLATVHITAEGQTRTEPRVWTAVSVQGHVAARPEWRWISDSILRTRDGAATLDVLAQRVIVTRELSGRSSIGVGYAYGAGFPDVGSIREHRLVQQYVWSQGVNWHLSLRSRLEERFLTGHGDVLLRGRQQLRLAWPLATRAGLQGVASEELFVQINSAPVAPHGFEGNRAFVGIARTLTQRSGMELGYMWVHTRESAGHDQSHVMVANVFLAVR